MVCCVHDSKMVLSVVHARDEERGHGVDRGQVEAVRARLLEAGQVRVDDLGIAFEAEDERHVHRHPGRHHGGDRRKSRAGRGDLDQHVGPRHRGVQGEGLRDGALGVVGELGGDLDRDVSVDAARRVVYLPQHIAGVAHVVGRDAEDGLIGGCRGRGFPRECRPVPRTAGDGRLEDRRVGRVRDSERSSNIHCTERSVSKKSSSSYRGTEKQVRVFENDAISNEHIQHPGSRQQFKVRVELGHRELTSEL